MNPLVSVIVPAYNSVSTLEETVSSVMASSYRPLEVVIVDDGSLDDTLNLALSLADRWPEVRVFPKQNQGVSAARNYAIARAQGKYILPVDADDLISTTYIAHAVEVLENNPSVRVVGTKARMFGDVNKDWNLRPFSHEELAMHNMIPVTSLFRRDDWQTVGGFCEQEIYREDHDFWLSVFSLGGGYVCLDEVGLFYRVRGGSRRSMAKSRQRFIVDMLNRRHPDYMNHYLGGPLHYHRSWSKFLNRFRHVTEEYNTSLPFRTLRWQEGKVICQKRNTLMEQDGMIIKHFAVPSLLRSLTYFFVASKARRSYRYALRLGNMTPAPVAYYEERYWGILRHSAYASLQSPCTGVFNDLIGHPDYPDREKILMAIGQFTARLHEQGILHLDYSGGNILFSEDGSLIHLVDLNRMRFYSKPVPREKGLRNFERLNIDRAALTIMAHAYAEARGYDADAAARYVIDHRWYKHVKQGITNL